MRTSKVMCLLCAVTISIALTGCASSPTPIDEPTLTQDEGTALPEGSFDVGIAELSDGRSRAVGVLGYSELEGGFWALYDTDPGEVPEDAPVVAVVANMGELDVSACSMEGKLVAADGMMSDGVSIRMAGPEIIADDVYEVPAG